MTVCMRLARLVAGALILATSVFAILTCYRGTGDGITSAAPKTRAGSGSMALLIRDEQDTMADGSISDGFDHKVRGVHEGEETSLHGHYRKHMRKHAATYVLFFLFQTAIMFMVAWLFRQYGPRCLPQESDPYRDPEECRAVFAYGLLDEKECWSEDLILCVLSWCCPGIQWANNVSNPKIGFISSFWVALTLATLNSYELDALTHGISFLVWVAIAVYTRQRLRGKYGLESGTLITMGQDIFVWCYCFRCAVAQEARQVEHVRTLDVRDTPYGEATQLQVDDEPASTRRTLLRPTEDGMGRENTANSEVSAL